MQVGLFGTQDPTYDGVFRQSLALLAYASAEQTPPQESVTWLLGQQCADGGFQAFREDTAKTCTKSDPTAYAGEDTNSTALAAAALTVLGKNAAASKALAWVRSSQNADGGFPYFLGGTSDANSTALALLATNAVGLSPTKVAKGGATASDYLIGLQVGCAGAAAGDDGGFAYADFSAGTANDAATVQAALAITGAALPFTADPPTPATPRASCPAPAAAAPADGSTSAAPAAVATPAAVVASPAELAGGYLARTLTTYDGAIPQLDFNSGLRKPGTVSAGDTAWAVLALSAIGVGGAQRDAALAVVLAQVGAAPARGKATVSDEAPGLLSLAALAVTASGGAASTADALVTRIGATLRTAPATATPTPTPTSPTPAPTVDTVDDGGLAPSGATPLTPGLAGAGALLLLLGSAALGLGRRQGSHA